MFVAQVQYDCEQFILDHPEALLSFPGEKGEQWERNWIPFVSDDTLLLAYSISPHRILRPFLGTNRCEEVVSTPFSSGWSWGVPKPGTAACIDGDHYLALFHSVQVMVTEHSEGKAMQHYFMGAYTFEDKPPFAITAISRSPMIGNHFYRGREYAMSKPCRVVFPCGIVVDDRFVWVVFGRQDHEIWMAKLEKQGLYENLTPVDASR